MNINKISQEEINRNLLLYEGTSFKCNINFYLNKSALY